MNTEKYTVKKGDTLSSISNRYNVPLSTLTSLNGIKNVNNIRVGLQLNIPVKQYDLVTPALIAYDQQYLLPNLTTTKLVSVKLSVKAKPLEQSESVTTGLNLWLTPEALNRLMFIESSFDPAKVNDGSGAVGLLLIIPSAYEDYVKATGERGDLKDPAFNIKVAKFMLDRFGAMPFVNAVDKKTNKVSDLNRAAKVYGSYVWGPGNIRDDLQRLKDAGYDIYNDDTLEWVYLLKNKDARDYIIRNLGLDEAYQNAYLKVKDNNKYAVTVYKQGGYMSYIDYLKHGSGIHIKKSHKGRFSSFCGGKVTEECIRRGKNSPSARVRKMATFALNARHFKH